MAQGCSAADPSAATQPHPLIAWDDQMALGVAEMDHQHRDLLVRLNALADALLDPDAHPVRLARLEDFVTATHRHFDWEEALMAAHGYPQLARHHDQHTELLGTIERLRDDLRQRGHAVNRPRTLRFFADWFRVHIIHSDADFVASIRRGAPPVGRIKENGHPEAAV